VGPPARPSAPVSRPEATTATVRIHFRSELPAGSLIVSVNGQEAVRENFGSRGGLGSIFHSRKQEPYENNWSKTVPAGTVNFRVHVAPAGQAAVVKAFSGGFQGGTTRSLEIHLSDAKQLTADLK
jgi:hypothetical protein